MAELNPNEYAYILPSTSQVVNRNGKPLTGGWINFYLTGTSSVGSKGTKYLSYKNWDGSLNEFNVPIDMDGRFIAIGYVGNAYDIYIYDSYGNQVSSRLNVRCTSSSVIRLDNTVVQNLDGTINVEKSIGENGEDIYTLEGVESVPNINMTSSDSFLAITEDIDEETNTKTFDITVNSEAPTEKNYLNANSVILAHTSAEQYFEEFSIIDGDIPLDEEGWFIVPSGARLLDISVTLDVVTVGDPSPEYETVEFRIKNKNHITYFMESRQVDWSLDHNVLTFQAKLKDINSLMFAFTSYNHDCIVYMTVRVNDESFLTLGDGSAPFIPSIRQLTDVDIVDAVPNQVLCINDDGLIENRFITFIAKYNVTDNAVIDEEFNKGSIIKCYRGYSYAEYLPLIRRIAKTSYPDPETYIYVFGVVYDGKVVEITSDPVDGWSVEETAVGGSGSTYTAGDCIDINNDEISVKYGKGLTVNASNALEVKAGNGLKFNEDTLEIEINNEVTEVVAAVEKLQRDLDTQITPNFDMPNIAKAYDFADPSVSTLANGACMLCQSFTIPINHEIRTITDDANAPTLMGIYAQQSFGHKIMLALYEYTYAKEGQSQGSSTYVGDTGPVNVIGGVNEFPLKNRNPSITELRCDKVYYATLYLPNAARSNGLYLAGCPGYGVQSIPAEPRLTCAVENITWDGQELDMNDPTATLNHYQEVIIPDEPVYYQYHIGPWQSGYNERWSAPRFYMQIRNGEYNVPVVPTEPFVDLGDVLPTGSIDMPSFTPSQQNSTFRDVTPAMNVTITAFEWIDSMQTAAQWAAEHCVYDSGFANNLSGQSNTVVELGQVVENGYAHRITFTTPITLTAGSTYRFLCGCSDGTQQFKIWLDPTNIIHASNNGWYLDNYNTIRIEHQFGMYNKLHGNSNNSWVI